MQAMHFSCASRCCGLGLGHGSFQPGPCQADPDAQRTFTPRLEDRPGPSSISIRTPRRLKTGGQKLTIRGHTLGARNEHQPGIHSPALTVGSLVRWPSSLGLCSALCSGLCRTVFEVPRTNSWASGMYSVYTAVFREPTQGWPAPPNPACILIV